jgi:hypothetical protein
MVSKRTGLRSSKERSIEDPEQPSLESQSLQHLSTAHQAFYNTRRVLKKSIEDEILDESVWARMLRMAKKRVGMVCLAVLGSSFAKAKHIRAPLPRLR